MAPLAPSTVAAAEAPARVARLRAGRVMGLPCGRRTPRGRRRWYVVQVPEGRELELCDLARRELCAPALDEALVVMRERWVKRGGTWLTEARPMYRGLFFAASRDAAALGRSLSRLTFAARLAGADGQAWTPVDDGVMAWLLSAADAEGVIRSSTAVIEGGVLRVEQGPLVGQESRMSALDRHSRRCLVRVSDADGGLTERMPLDIPFKS